MIVKELMDRLADADPEAEVVVIVEGPTEIVVTENTVWLILEKALQLTERPS